MYSSGPGGYVSSLLYLSETTRAYIMIGGQGTYKAQPFSGDPFSKSIYIPGGYGGGGPSRPLSFKTDSPSASGGGRTSLMMLEDDIFHSVLVAGGGGGSDDFQTNNDGKGGAGGGISAQSFWIDGTYFPQFESSSSHFFSYGFGEAVAGSVSLNPDGSKYGADTKSEYAGAGGGWFGGFASYYYNAGAGGGSSFALTHNATIPTSMTVRDSFYENPITNNYAFTESSKYLMTKVIHAPGIWIGNGMFRITLEYANLKFAQSCNYNINSMIYSLLRASMMLQINISL